MTKEAPPRSGSVRGSSVLKRRPSSDHLFEGLKRRPSSDLQELQFHANSPNNNSHNHLNSSNSRGLDWATANEKDNDETNDDDDHDVRKDHRGVMARLFQGFSSIRLVVLLVLCFQNSLFTVLRRYSQGVLKERYSKYECLLVGELVKLAFSAYMIGKLDVDKNSSSSSNSSNSNNHSASLKSRLGYLVLTSRKMIVLALIYGAMNILSFVALRNIGAGVFTVIAQCKILTTATFSKLLLQRQYSATKWRALIALVFGVLLFSEPIWSKADNLTVHNENAQPVLGIIAVSIEVTLSGFASIYFEKVIKADALHLSIWERNFQLALGSVPVYLAFILSDRGGEAGFGGGWSLVALMVSLLGAAGGLLVALSIKYGDAILKTLATTGAIILSSVLDHTFLGGPLTPVMMIAGVQVVIAICNYTFDPTPAPMMEASSVPATKTASKLVVKQSKSDEVDEEIALIQNGSDKN